MWRHLCSGPRWPDAERPQAEPSSSTGSTARLTKADRLAPQRRRVGGCEYNHRRDNRVEDHAATESRRCGRHCGVPAEQGGVVMNGLVMNGREKNGPVRSRAVIRTLRGRQAESFVRKLEQRGASTLGRV